MVFLQPGEMRFDGERYFLRVLDREEMPDDLRIMLSLTWQAQGGVEFFGNFGIGHYLHELSWFWDVY